MGTHQRYLTEDVIRNLVLAGLFLTLAKVGLLFSLPPTTITIFWPAGGLALAVLLLGGLKYLPGIFVGEFAAGLMEGYSPTLSMVLGVADTLESFSGYWLLTHTFRFNPNLEIRQDFFKLTILAGGIASAVSAVIGPTTLLLENIFPASLYPTVCLRWWMGDVLGITFITPLILLWSHPPKRSNNTPQLLEVVAIFVLAFLVGQLVFFDWFKDVTNSPQGTAWIALMVIWAALRTNRHTTSLVQLMLFVQLLWSASHDEGSFAQDMVRSGLINFWIFGMALAVGGMAIAVISAENTKIRSDWQRLHDSISSSLNEIYMLDADTLYFFFVNEGARKNIGYTMEELRAMTPLDLAPYHSEQSLKEWLLPLLQHVKPVVVCEGMHRRKDGTLYPIEVHMQLFENSNQRYFQAVVIDISDRLEAEHELRLAAQVFENSMDGIVVTDANNRIVSTNRAYTQITGYAEAEVKGSNPSVVASGKHDEAFYQAMWDVINNTGHWSGEIWNRRKNGEIYPEWMKISAIKNQQGELVNYVGIFSDISERKANESTLQYQAMHDFLTNLPNRTLFHDRVQQSIARGVRDHKKFALIYLDLDDFKPVNDTYGHRMGDLLLQAVAKRLAEDTRQTDTVCRLGGDEFAILMPGIWAEAEVSFLARKLQDTLDQWYQIEGVTLRITTSIGFAIYPDHGIDEESLMAYADSKMYQMKKSRLPDDALPT